MLIAYVISVICLSCITFLLFLQYYLILIILSFCLLLHFLPVIFHSNEFPVFVLKLREMQVGFHVAFGNLSFVYGLLNVFASQVENTLIQTEGQILS